MAGAEGIEPSARGFGGDVGKRPGRGAVRPFQAVTGFEQVVLQRGDALLVLCHRCDISIYFYSDNGMEESFSGKLLTK